MPKKPAPLFERALFQFLRDLAAHNDRTWFAANKQRYEDHVKAPFLRFIEAFGPKLHKISPRFVADPAPTGGSFFRIYRDTRFSADKSPYKTAASAHFTHVGAGEGHHVPGFYLHLAPEEVFAGFGIWRPDGPALGKIRQAIADDGAGWKRAIKGRTLDGESLARAPRGFPAEHPLAEDLKRKDFITSARYDEKQACAADFLDRFARDCKQASPFMSFLTQALGCKF